MYEELLETMDKHGFLQYEISNFSRPGYESKHNLTYWNNEEYYGFGAGAHSYINGMRRANFGPLKKYMDPLHVGRLPVLEETQPKRSERMEEEMFLGLRKNEGVSISRFKEKFGEDLLELFSEQIHDLQEKGLIESEHNHVKLTRKGRFLGNEVFQLFLGVV